MTYFKYGFLQLQLADIGSGYACVYEGIKSLCCQIIVPYENSYGEWQKSLLELKVNRWTSLNSTESDAFQTSDHACSSLSSLKLLMLQDKRGTQGLTCYTRSNQMPTDTEGM